MQNNNNDALVILLLGIGGLVFCQICSPIAWVMGNKYVASCQAMGRQPDQMGVIGRILGIVGTILLALTLVFLVVYFLIIGVVIAGAAAGSI